MAWVLSEARFGELTIMPAERVTELGNRAPTFLASQLAAESSKAVARLRKRYPAFVAPVPVVLEQWVTRLVTARCYLRLGIDTTSDQFKAIADDAQNSEAQLTEAANGETGLLELSMNDAVDTSAAIKGGPLFHAEASPYSWLDVQEETVRNGG
jgi:hypothetical protein